MGGSPFFQVVAGSYPDLVFHLLVRLSALRRDLHLQIRLRRYAQGCHDEEF